MPTQTEISEHLGMSQSGVSQHLDAMQIDWKTCDMDFIRLAYLDHLRSLAIDRSTNGQGLARERALTEIVDRELKQMNLAERKSQVVNLSQLEFALTQMVQAYRLHLDACDAQLKAEIDRLYGIGVDLVAMQQYTHNALAQFGKYYQLTVAIDGDPPPPVQDAHSRRLHDLKAIPAPDAADSAYDQAETFNPSI